jgi:hypothetical protein
VFFGLFTYALLLRFQMSRCARRFNPAAGGVALPMDRSPLR